MLFPFPIIPINYTSPFRVGPRCRIDLIVKFDIFEDSADNRKSMRQVKFQKNHPFFQVLFWGSLWGLTEATLGHLLHLLKVPGLAGFFMFPIGLYFMIRAFRTVGKTSAIPAVAAIAASLKLVDLFLPGTQLFQAINPALAILAESLALLFIVKFLKHPVGLFRPRNILSVTLGWRLIYGAFQIILAAVLLETTGFLQLGNAAILRFFLFDSLVNLLLIFGVLHLHRSIKFPRVFFRMSPRPGKILALFLSAVLTNILF